MKTVVRSVASIAIVATLCSCAIVKSVVDLAACITDHAIDGDSLAKIAVGCGSDIPPVVTAIIQSTDQRVLSSKAHAECETLWKVVETQAPKPDVWGDAGATSANWSLLYDGHACYAMTVPSFGGTCLQAGAR